VRDRHPQRYFRNHHIVTANWDGFVPRDGDIVIATPAKGGTTWTQAIVAHLLFADGLPAPLSVLSPWLDFAHQDRGHVHRHLEEQKHRRFLKTHLPANGLPLFESVKYIVVLRDGRDLLMSMWNHYANYSPASFQSIGNLAAQEGQEFPPPPANLDAFARDWCTRGWFPWETDGWPFWSQLDVMQTWWELRSEANVLLLTFNDMLVDRRESVRRIAAFLGIRVSEQRVIAIADDTGFERMKQRGQLYAPYGGIPWNGGADTFFYKGINNRWRNALSAETLTLYEAASARALAPACRELIEAPTGSSEA